MTNSENPLHRSVPFLCLVDFDPHGLEILSIYKYGSQNMALHNESLVVMGLKWLGIHANDFSINDSTVVPFTNGDFDKLDKIRLKEFLLNINDSRNWIEQISIMKAEGVKAEIEILSDKEGGISQQIRHKIESHDWL